MRCAERDGPSGPLVFPATRGDGPMKGFRKLWNKILKLGEVASDVTPNVLRHSFVSLGADLGYSDITIGQSSATKAVRSHHVTCIPQILCF